MHLSIGNVRTEHCIMHSAIFSRALYAAKNHRKDTTTHFNLNTKAHRGSMFVGPVAKWRTLLRKRFDVEARSTQVLTGESHDNEGYSAYQSYAQRTWFIEAHYIFPFVKFSKANHLLCATMARRQPIFSTRSINNKEAAVDQLKLPNKECIAKASTFAHFPVTFRGSLKLTFCRVELKIMTESSIWLMVALSSPAYVQAL